MGFNLINLYRGEAVSSFKHHTAPITTLEWHYSDSTVFASAGEDNQVCLCMEDIMHFTLVFSADTMGYCC